MGLTWTIRATAATLVSIALCAISAAARADILLDQPPGHHGGPGADTAFYNDLGFPSYEITADDFAFQSEVIIYQIRWFGFYGGNFSGSTDPPPGPEVMRVRVYDDTGPEGLPGSIVYEETYLNASRTQTGQWAGGGQTAYEYRFEVSLGTPLRVQANSRYWLEMVQVGDIDSTFRIENGYGNQTPFAFMNPYTNGQWVYVYFLANLSFQLIGVPEPQFFAPTLLGFLYVASKRRGKERTWA